MKTRPYQYKRCGLDYVYLLNGYTEQKTEYGEGVSIEDVEGVHRAIAEDVVRHRAHLSGKEIRFLRKEMDLAQSGLAKLLGVDAQTVARWEKGVTQIPVPADRLLRVIYERHAGGDADIVLLIEALNELDDYECGQRHFEENGRGWHIAA